MSVDAWIGLPDRPRLTVVPDPPAIPFKVACLPEYRRRLLGVYAAVDGWPRERVAPLWPFVECASRAFEAEAAGPWLMALGELEKRAGVTA